MPVNAKGPVITGEDARAKIVDDILTKQDLSVKDLEFILAKLKSAQYTGSEFEHFYSVWVKLSAMLESLKVGK